jgi:preprotein translocase subunit Sec63
MSTEYNYDEQGQFFPFFFVTVAGLVTLPVTYSLLKPSKGNPQFVLSNLAPNLFSIQTLKTQRRESSRPTHPNMQISSTDTGDGRRGGNVR